MCPKGPMSFCRNLFGSFVKRFNMSCSSLNVYVFCCCICFHFQPCCGQNLWGRNSHCFAVIVINPIVGCLYTYKDPLGMTIFKKIRSWSALAHHMVAGPCCETPGVDSDVQCHVPGRLGCEWFLCPVARQLMLWYRGRGFNNNNKILDTFFLGARDLVHVFRQSNKGEVAPWLGRTI